MRQQRLQQGHIYDQAAILISGKIAKTNFPIPRNQLEDATPCDDSSLSHKAFSELLNTKLRKCCNGRSLPFTCLRLDVENSHIIRVCRKGAGPHANSNWVTRVELGKKNESDIGKGVEEEDRVAITLKKKAKWNLPYRKSSRNKKLIFLFQYNFRHVKIKSNSK